jgi:hypothetical protein
MVTCPKTPSRSLPLALGSSHQTSTVRRAGSTAWFTIITLPGTGSSPAPPTRRWRLPRLDPGHLVLRHLGPATATAMSTTVKTGVSGLTMSPG